MLSRVANCLYWMLRYVERADDLARLIKVNEELLLDLGRHEGRHQLWRPILLAAGDEPLFTRLHGEGDSDAILRFLATDRANPNSIHSCIAHARENARMVRDQLSEALWEELNGLWLELNSPRAAIRLRRGPADYFDIILRATYTIHGIAASTISRDEGWEFMDLGRYLERADKTTRFLDIASYLPTAGAFDGGLPADYHWAAILRSCGAVSAHRASFPSITPETVVQLLLFSPDFPRSVRHCLDRVDAGLHRLSSTPRNSYTSEAERLAGQTLARLAYGSVAEVFASGLHTWLDDFQFQLNRIGDEIFRRYFLLRDEIDARSIRHRQPTPTATIWEQQMQQQQ